MPAGNEAYIIERLVSASYSLSNIATTWLHESAWPTLEDAHQQLPYILARPSTLAVRIIHQTQEVISVTEKETA